MSNQGSRSYWSFAINNIIIYRYGFLIRYYFVIFGQNYAVKTSLLANVTHSKWGYENSIQKVSKIFIFLYYPYFFNNIFIENLSIYLYSHTGGWFLWRVIITIKYEGDLAVQFSPKSILWPLVFKETPRQRGT